MPIWLDDKVTWIGIQLYAMHVDLTRLDIVGSVCTCLCLNEHVILVGMVLSNVQKGFKWKGHTYEMSLFLTCYHSMCAYGLILSTNGVLTPFLSFPQHFRFHLLKCFEEEIGEGLDLLFI